METNAGSGKKHCLYVGNRAFNLRPVFVLAATAFAAAFAARNFRLFSLFGLLIIAAVFLLVLLFKKKKEHRLRYTLLFAALIAVVYGGVCVGFCAERSDYESAPVLAGEFTVTGKAKSVSVIDGGCRVILDDVRIQTAESYFTAGHNLLVYIFGAKPYATGSILRFTSELETLDFISYGDVSAANILDGVKYRASVNAADVEKMGEKFDLFGAVRDRMRSVLTSSMNKDKADIAYAMLTGDSNSIDEGMLSEFRYGGVAHIFAVSGLHIGVLYAMLTFFFKRLRAKAYVKLPVTAFVLIFYAGVCGFSPSSVRAVIMCIALALSDWGGMKYDALNSVSLAALCVVLFNPVYFYSVGFRLSIAAAGGIIVSGGTLSRLFAKIRFLPRKLTSAVSVCLSAQLATFPVLLDSFGYVSALGLILNLLFVPVISAVYAILFVAAVFSCILPSISFILLWLPETALSLAIVPILSFDWKVMLICGFSFGMAAIPWYGLLFFLSDKINLKRLPKLIGTFALSVLIASGLLAGNIFIGGTRIGMYSMYGTDLLFVEKGNTSVLIVTGAIDPDYADRYFLKEGVKSLDAVVLSCGAAEADSALAAVLSLTDVARAYLPAESDFADSFRTVEIKREYGPFSVNGIGFEFVGDTGVMLCTDGVSVLVAAEGFDTDSFYPSDLLIAQTYVPEVFASSLPEREIYFQKTDGKLNVYDAGGLQIRLKNGIISCRGKNLSYEVRVV